MRKQRRVVDAFFEHVAKTALRQQLHVFGEHREQATHQKQRDGFRVIKLFAVLALGLFEMLGDFRQPLGDFARRLGRDLGRVQLVRIEPYQAKPLANVVAAKVFEVNSKALAVGKLRVVFALSRKVGVNLEAMANVANDEEGRPALGQGQAP